MHRLTANELSVHKGHLKMYRLLCKSEDPNGVPNCPVARRNFILEYPNEDCPCIRTFE